MSVPSQTNANSPHSVRLSNLYKKSKKRHTLMEIIRTIEQFLLINNKLIAQSLVLYLIFALGLDILNMRASRAAIWKKIPLSRLVFKSLSKINKNRKQIENHRNNRASFSFFRALDSIATRFHTLCCDFSSNKHSNNIKQWIGSLQENPYSSWMGHEEYSLS